MLYLLNLLYFIPVYALLNFFHFANYKLFRNNANPDR